MLRKMKLDLNKKEGFTLIELMIVVAILGVLAAVAIPQYMNYIATSKRRAAYENFESAKKGVMGEFARINGGNPARTEAALAAELNGRLLDTVGVPDTGTPIFNWNPYQKGAKAAAIMGTTQYTNPAFLGGAVAVLDGDVGMVFNAYVAGEPVVGVSSVTITLLYTDENSNRLVPEAATITFE